MDTGYNDSESVENRLKKDSLKTAKSLYNNLISGEYEKRGWAAAQDWTVGIIPDLIKKHLETSGAGLEALDSGKSAIEIQKNIEQGVKAGQIAHVKTYLEEIRGGDTHMAEYIEPMLGRIGTDLTAIFPGSNLSEARGELSKIVRGGYLNSARKEFSELGRKDYFSVEEQIEIIKHDLRKAGAGLEDLDPKGKKSEAQIEQEITEKTKEYYISTARKIFGNILKLSVESMKPDELYKIGYEVGRINEHLKEAKENYSALDPEGKKSHETMDKELSGKVAIIIIGLADKAKSSGDSKLLSQIVESASKLIWAMDKDALEKLKGFEKSIHEEELKTKYKIGSNKTKYKIGSNPGRAI